MNLYQIVVVPWLAIITGLALMVVGVLTNHSLMRLLGVYPIALGAGALAAIWAYTRGKT